MRFQKGHKINNGRKPWNKGMKGMKPWYDISGLHPHRKGSFNHSKETKEKMKIVHIGKLTGIKCYFWKGGITPLRMQIRASFRYRQWISDVFTRDDFTCQECGKRGGTLNAHHIKPFFLICEENKIITYEQALDCEELWNINNGKTLCERCHSKTKGYKLRTMS
jgi:hypothetical protein